MRQVTVEIIPLLRENLVGVVGPVCSNIMRAYAEAVEVVEPEERHEAISMSMYLTLVGTLVGEALVLVDHAPPNMTREQAKSIVKAILESALHDIDLPVEERGEHKRIIGPNGNIKRGDH